MNKFQNGVPNNKKSVKLSTSSSDFQSTHLPRPHNDLRLLGPNDFFHLLPKIARGEYKVLPWKNMKVRDFSEVFGALDKYSSFFRGAPVLEIQCEDG